MAEHDAKVDALLREFLESDRKDREAGLTMPSLHEKQDRLYRTVQRVAFDRLEDRQRLERYGRRLRRVENQLSLVSASPQVPVPDWHAEASEITGTYEFRALQKQTHELSAELDAERTARHDSALWWRRKRWEWGAAAIGAVVMSIVSAIVAFLAATALKK